MKCTEKFCGIPHCAKCGEHLYYAQKILCPKCSLRAVFIRQTENLLCWDTLQFEQVEYITTEIDKALAGNERPGWQVFERIAHEALQFGLPYQRELYCRMMNP